MNTETRNTLKPRAKRLRAAIQAMLGVSINHAQALELIAQEENYPNWDAACASHLISETQSHPSILANVTASDFLVCPSHQMGRCVIAPAGSGKSQYARSLIIDYLRQGKIVVVIDWGRTYAKMVEALGGTYCDLQPGGNYKLRQFGNVPLWVYDFDAFLRINEPIPGLDALDGQR